MIPQTVLALWGSGGFNLVPRISESWSRGGALAVTFAWCRRTCGHIRGEVYLFNELLPPEGDFSAQIYFFNELLPPEGDFSAQIYFFHELLPPEGD